MSVKRWLGTMLLQAIPVVGIILLFVWAFGKKSIEAYPVRRNYARATLLLSAIGLVVYIAIIIFVGVSVA